MCPRLLLPHTHQLHHQIPGSTKGSPSPKWLFHFLKLKYGMGEGCPMALPQLLRGWGQGTGPRLAHTPRPPQETKESGLENLANKSWHSPCPCPGGANQSPKPPLRDLPSRRLLNPHTPPKGEQGKERQQFTNSEVPWGRGGADKWDPPPLPQPGLAQGECPNPPE